MKEHVKIYHKSRGIHPGDFISCEVCGAPAVDIHHIESRGMGGAPHKNTADNLVALCRKDHEEAHAGGIHKDTLKAMAIRYKVTDGPLF